MVFTCHVWFLVELEAESTASFTVTCSYSLIPFSLPPLDEPSVLSTTSHLPTWCSAFVTKWLRSGTAS